ncbi:MAG: 16S rRNA (cytidine(1402)-2'-O)-methyltransferase [Candidatus Bipolaricaulota bacterium]
MDDQRGTFYVIATPIGNLQDITLRALEVLQNVDAIIAEDTRRSKKLLEAHDISTPFTRSYYQGAEGRIPWIVDQLNRGRDLALISDAGSPLISDPGFKLVRAVRAEGLQVVPIPGPSAVTTALMASGQPTDSFVFLGMLPKGKGKKRKVIDKLKTESRTAVFFESPHRLLDTLSIVKELIPERDLTICREMTKKHEEFLQGKVQDLLEDLEDRERIRGELTLLVDGASEEDIAATRKEKYSEVPIPDQVKGMELLKGLSQKQAMKEVAQLRGISKRDVYDEIIESG